MKIFRTVTMFGAMFAVAAGPALAYKFSPTKTKFTLSGGIGVLFAGSFHSCNVAMRGKIPGLSKEARIETFSDLSGCGIAATNLPWPLKAKGAGTATIIGLAYTVPGNVCGPSTAQARVSDSGIWNVNFKTEGSGGVCRAGGSLRSDPAIIIVSGK